jgi:cell division protein FtsW
MFAEQKPMTLEMRHTTQWLVLCVMALICLGTIMIFSVTEARTAPTTTGGGFGPLFTRIAWVCLGIAAALVASLLDLNWLAKKRWHLYGLALLMLAVVLVPGVGSSYWGARRWISLKVISVQPSELAKILVLVFIAAYVQRHRMDMRKLKDGLVMPSIAILVACGLIFLEPDYGTGLLLGLVGLSMLLIAGARAWYIVVAGLSALPLVGIMIWHSPNRVMRVLAFLDPWKYQQGPAYQEIQSLIAIGSGGLWGKGLGAGDQKLGFLPQAETDFVASVIGEEMGFIGVAAVLVVFVVFIWLGLKIASRASDLFSQTLATGITLLIGIQAMIHIAVVTGSAPTKGITLPFVSFGGTSLVGCMVGVGILLAVARGARAEPAPAPAIKSAPLATAQTQ